jgi:predicted RNA-binding Zn-ribbon protein involved in translation (DUF1610 family)
MEDLNGHLDCPECGQEMKFLGRTKKNHDKYECSNEECSEQGNLVEFDEDGALME